MFRPQQCLASSTALLIAVFTPVLASTARNSEKAKSLDSGSSENTDNEIYYVVLHPSQYMSPIPPPTIEQVACYNTVLMINCPPTSVLTFESARYGRNDTSLAVRCAVPFTRHCDVDVHFLLNRACAGRRKCSLVVGASTFGDPCGYEEFLRVEYRCVPVNSIHTGCPSLSNNDLSSRPASSAAVSSSSLKSSPFSPSSSVLYGRGYLSSPSYPDRYYSDADCRWTLVVQRLQMIRITIYDFELDIKRAGRCKDVLEISAGLTSSTSGDGDGRLSVGGDMAATVYFRDCGALGRHTVDVEWNVAVVQFVVDQSSLTQRGFFLYFEAVGPGCGDLPVPPSIVDDVRIVYYFDARSDVTSADGGGGGSILRANASCLDDRSVLAVTGAGDSGAPQRPTSKLPASSISVYCTGVRWSDVIPAQCVDADLFQTIVVPPELLPTDSTTLITAAASGNFFFLSSSASIIGECFYE